MARVDGNVLNKQVEVSPVHLSKEALTSLGILGLLVISLSLGLYVLEFPQTITGRAVDAVDTQYPNYQTGVYAVHPHTQVSLPLDFSAYDLIAPGIEQITTCVSNGGTLAECTEQQSTQTHKWELGCGSDDSQNAFNGFVDALQQVIDAPEQECVLKRTFLPQTPKLHISKSGPETLSISSSTHQQTFKSDFFGRGFVKSLTIQDEQLQWETLSNTVQTPPEVYFRKLTVNDQQIIELATRLDQRFVSITDSGPVDVTLDGSTPTCSLPVLPIHEFCIHTSSELSTYDSDQQKYVNKPFTVQFAAHMPRSAPSKVRSLLVQDHPKDDKHLIVSWRKSPESDIESYQLIVTTQNLSHTPTAQLEDLTTHSFVVGSEEPLQIQPVFTHCTFNRFEQQCEFGEEKQSLQADTLYYHEEQQRYVVKLAVGQDSFVGVVAKDLSGQALTNEQDEKIAFAYRSVIDDLAPNSREIIEFPFDLSDHYSETDQGLVFESHQFPEFNVDGTQTSDNEHIFGFVSTTEPDQTTTIETILESGQQISVDRTLPNGRLVVRTHTLDPGTEYWVVVVALDPDQPLQHRYTPFELGVRPLLLRLPS